MRSRRAHSLIELLIVIAIIALVIAMILGTFVKVHKVIDSWK
jgi:type II secretory pathway pseudopilin PulG